MAVTEVRAGVILDVRRRSGAFAHSPGRPSRNRIIQSSQALGGRVGTSVMVRRRGRRRPSVTHANRRVRRVWIGSTREAVPGPDDPLAGHQLPTTTEKRRCRTPERCCILGGPPEASTDHSTCRAWPAQRTRTGCVAREVRPSPEQGRESRAPAAGPRRRRACGTVSSATRHRRCRSHADGDFDLVGGRRPSTEGAGSRSAVKGVRRQAPSGGRVGPGGGVRHADGARQRHDALLHHG